MRGPGPNRQRGFTLVSAIFLMVVLVILASSLVTLAAVQQVSSAQQLQALRADQAARAGIEWALGRIATGACPPGPTTLAPGGALAGFGVSVRCAAATHLLADGATQVHYTVDSVASYGAYGSVDYVRRHVQARLGS